VIDCQADAGSGLRLSSRDEYLYAFMRVERLGQSTGQERGGDFGRAASNREVGRCAQPRRCPLIGAGGRVQQLKRHRVRPGARGLEHLGGPRVELGTAAGSGRS